ncbi:hypothetical protein SMSP2_01091 [Limihaloglobus sulfuriphilus]|uniref:Uncharacterized protein n=1 Tax=Limihaloglobus sulfuriphilus TaxID=1851148 RepID=A0A1Q2MDH7_9BACT|nr:hypothetical protein [Limihaloglobus sulfuriphilus]AQQ70730.1 hypothetical protein SMSP2_01091 [Limihaloglobus sulfuriphilus]
MFANHDPVNGRDDWGLFYDSTPWNPVDNPLTGEPLPGWEPPVSTPVSIGTKISGIVYSRLLTGLIINRLRTNCYTLEDEQREIESRFKDYIRQHYIKKAKRNGKIRFDTHRVAGDWNFGGAIPPTTAYWLGGAHRVSANGSFDVCCKGINCQTNNLDVQWTWYDDIDAHDFKEALNTYE